MTGKTLMPEKSSTNKSFKFVFATFKVQISQHIMSKFPEDKWKNLMYFPVPKKLYSKLIKNDDIRQTARRTRERKIET